MKDGKRQKMNKTKKTSVITWVQDFFDICRQTLNKQDSKELSPRPLENAPKTFNSKKTL